MSKDVLPLPEADFTNPSIRRAYRHWLQVRGNYRALTKHGKDFDFFYGRFARMDSLVSIGDETGMSRERIRQLYARFFMECFEGKTYRERARAIAAEKKTATP